MTFTPIRAILGGALIGLAAFWNARLNGLVTGVAGTLNSCLTLNQYAMSFVAGLISSTYLLQQLVDAFPDEDVLSLVSPNRLILSAILVGAGTRIGNGCTSGHGVCGLARLSFRSFVAVLTFIVVAMIVATLYPPANFVQKEMPPELSVPRLAVLLTLSLAVPPLFALLRASVAVRFSLGIIFGAGLIISGMWHPTKTLGFLRLPVPLPAPFEKTQAWDPSLLFVFVGALPVAFAGFQPILRGIKPLLAEKHSFPTVTNIDARLLLGSSMFGAGWGMIGVCPGPALVYGGRFPGVSVLMFLLSMLGGSLSAQVLLETIGV
ncbi:hypothetical protein BWQ96_00220 [Gracilariopsis chorda]|uniref:Uncharacterized protein n=1 Tax=Gracilariopsis chorda TaxID=448386 RepID=A0A2V3JDA3_9FLOR|nr:hypothetical protein BWQ96_00220 [Gracilariopsis chorda]|eukprot:PXF50060.1 hypothetical protein BWQ96_00220 [Gracilariopsis chorda]